MRPTPPPHIQAKTIPNPVQYTNIAQRLQSMPDRGSIRTVLCALLHSFIFVCLLVKERGNESTKGQMAKKEAPKVEKEPQKAGKASMCTNRQKHLSIYSH